MRFPYQSYPVPGIGGPHLALVHRPALPIRVIGPAGDALAYGLADTGADDTILPDRLLAPLGVVIRPGDYATIAALGGAAVAVRYGTVDLELGRGGAVYRWSARVAFYAGSRSILGHAGFLEHFTATFNGRRRHLILTPNGTAPPSTMPTP